MKNNSAVLIFANSAQKEILKKGIPSPELFDQLNDQVLKTVKKSGLEYFLITENEQKGNSFGERFSNAIQQIYDKGFENVISIGNDTPQLKVSHLLETNKLLKERKIVLGPSVDGGFYLMGIHKTLFQKDNFSKLPWQTKALATCVEDFITSLDEESYRLETLQDIDNSNDLKAVLKISKAISSTIIILIIRLIEKSGIFDLDHPEFYSNQYSYSFHNKGSPVRLHI